jgi:hypothetical protein
MEGLIVANNLTSNVTRKLMRTFLKHFESNRVITKSVDTQLLSGKFNPSSGSTVDFKRPHDYRSIRTSDGDLSAATKDDIIAGKATGTVQDYFTSATEWANVEEALELDQLDKILAPMATRICTDLETDFAAYMAKNCNLSTGTPGNAVDTWKEVAYAGAMMESVGVPADTDWSYAMNPYTAVALAEKQTELASGSNDLVDRAWRKALVANNFAGMQVLKSTHLYGFTASTAADKAGQVDGNPTVTYVGNKDSMIQTIHVDGITAGTVVKAGEILEITGRNRLSLSTRQPIVDQAGANVKWRGVITADATFTAGEADLLVAGPAIYEANVAYNTTDSAVVDGDVATIISPTGTFLQPNLFWHKQAFGLGTCKLPKLYSTDTVATTKDGMSIRVSKYSDGDKNKQKIRFDLLPAYATFNPFFAGHSYGTA